MIHESFDPFEFRDGHSQPGSNPDPAPEANQDANPSDFSDEQFSGKNRETKKDRTETEGFIDDMFQTVIDEAEADKAPGVVRETLSTIRDFFKGSKHKNRKEYQEAKEELVPVHKALRIAYRIARDHRASHDMKVAAADEVFEALKRVLTDKSSKVAKVLRKTLTVKHKITGTKDEDSFASMLTGNLASATPESIAKGVDPFVDLLHELWKVEEQQVFDFLAKEEHPVTRIDAASELAKDFYYLSKQGRAILRLAGALRGSFQKHFGEPYPSRPGSDMDQMKEVGKRGTAFLKEVAPVLAASVEDLGVYWQKLAQTAGAAISGLSPKAYERIEHFQNQVSWHMSHSETLRIIEADLGAPVSELFLEFDPEPFAVASIAQVHRAKIATKNGTRDVVVKVKKSHVAEELEWNMRVIKAFTSWVKASNGLGSAHIVADIILDQALALGETFKKELDFRAEARRQIRFGRIFALDRHIQVPAVHRKLSGNNTITMNDIGDCEKLNFHLNTVNWKEALHPNSHYHAPASSYEPASSPEPEPNTASEPQPTETNKYDNHETDSTSEAPANETHKEESPGEFEQLYYTLSNNLGYRLGAQYIQLFRALAPPLGLVLQSTQRQAQLEDKGYQLTEEDKAELAEIKQRGKTLRRAVFDQILHIKELHSDLQPANVQVDDRNRLHLIDFGQTMNTRGLILLPVRLLSGVIRGNAEDTAKVLAKMGSFEQGKSYKDILPLVQKTFDSLAIPKSSYWQLFKGWLGDERDRVQQTRSASRKNKDFSKPSKRQLTGSNRAKSKVIAETRPSESNAHTRTNSNSLPQSESTSQDSPNEKTVRLLPLLFKSGMKALFQFPLKRIKYSTLSIYDRIAR